MTIRAPLTLETLWRSSGSKVSSVPDPASTMSPPASTTRRTVDDHQPRPFTDLVIAEFLTRREADDDRPCPVDGLESGRPTCPLWHFYLFHVPRLHGC